MTDLFEPYTPGLARNDGAQTSKDAAVAIMPASAKQRMQLLRMLAAIGRPAIAQELEDLTGLSGNSVRPRLVELADDRDGKAPLVRKTGEQGITRAGRKADLWTITNAGRSVLRHIDGKAE